MSLQEMDMKEERTECFISFPFSLKYLHLERNLNGGFSESDITQQTQTVSMNEISTVGISNILG